MDLISGAARNAGEDVLPGTNYGLQCERAGLQPITTFVPPTRFNRNPTNQELYLFKDLHGMFSKNGSHSYVMGDLSVSIYRLSF